MGRDSRVNHSVRRHEVVGESLANHRAHIEQVIGWIQRHAEQHAAQRRHRIVLDLLFVAALVYLLAR